MGYSRRKRKRPTTTPMLERNVAKHRKNANGYCLGGEKFQERCVIFKKAPNFSCSPDPSEQIEL